MRTNLTAWVTRVADLLEVALWAAQDERARAAGWEVERLGRWGRRYRHPAMVAALAAVHARNEDTGRGWAA